MTTTEMEKLANELWDTAQGYIEGIGPNNSKYAKKDFDLIVNKFLSLFSSELSSLQGEVEKMKKNISVSKQAEVALKNQHYSLIQIRSIVKGYNKAISDVLALMKGRGK